MRRKQKIYTDILMCTKGKESSGKREGMTNLAFPVQKFLICSEKVDSELNTHSFWEPKRFKNSPKRVLLVARG